MAGPHQIWKMDLDKQEVSTFAGSGREARKDGSLLEAGFAQPSGITSDGKKLYIADSESNIIREIDPASGQVETLVGGDLFEFGDVDGAGDDVRLQHPLGVFALGDKVLIADTYNHKIKELNPEAAHGEDLLGTRQARTSGRRLTYVLRTRRIEHRERQALRCRHKQSCDPSGRSEDKSNVDPEHQRTGTTRCRSRTVRNDDGSAKCEEIKRCYSESKAGK